MTCIFSATAEFVAFVTSGQAIRAPTGAGGQCADAIEAGVGADGPARIHTGTASGGLGREKGWDRAAHVLPGWTGRTASVL